MAIDKTQGLQTRNARDAAATSTEATRPGVLLTPPVDIFEDPEAITVVADMPGVKPGQLTVDLHEGLLTITGRVDPPERPEEAAVVQEYRAGTFQRNFVLSETIDQSKIQATLKHGILRLRLPKMERVRPRQIEIHSA